MEKDDEKFFDGDQVATVSSNTGLVKYGVFSQPFRKTSYMNRNKIRVFCYPNGAEENIPDDKVVLMERTFTPGDVVRKVSEGKSSQLGYCENIDIHATVKILNTNKIIENINSRDLPDINVCPYLMF
ncbi:uncharacterized protein LOC107883180 [Acyrthosiphon pisum]|uniref:Uncharacterized protein n=1 Tax=Acyrthosiphon pisum TaxID=7029 RepID=A0A8R2JLJ6_ACYPI|nr:uncharacterized protein LOC107883180 [Acyrthosiphon pisum]